MDTFKAEGQLKMKNKKMLLNLIAIQVLFWFGWQFATYQIVYLQDNGMSTYEVGIMSAACSLVSMVASILWGWISDRMNSVKKAFILNLLLSIAFIVALPLLPTNFKYASAMFIVYRALSCLGQGPLGTFIDNHAVRNCEQYGLNFGTLTAFKCISGTLGGLISTLVLTKIDVKYTFWIFGLLMIPTLICIAVSNDPKSSTDHEPDMKHGVAGDITLLLRSYHFLIFIVFTILFNVAHQAVAVFIPSFMSDIGVDSANWGLYSAVRLISSVPLMFMFGWIRKRMKLKVILILSCIFMGMESLLLGLFARDLATLLVCGAIYGLGSGLFMGAVPLYILEHSPENLKASAHNIYGAVYLGAGVIGNLCGGRLYETVGGFSFYVLLSIIMFLAVLLFGISHFFGPFQKKENRADEV